MKKVTVFAGVSVLLGLALVVIFCYSPVFANQLTQEVDRPQIAMVIDVSNSMSTFLFPSELPGDLKLIQDRIDEIEGMEEFVQLSEGLKAIDEDPNVVQARDAYQSAKAVVETWLAENGFKTRGEIVVEVSTALNAAGCQPGFADGIVNADNMAAVDALIGQACEPTVVSQELAQTIKAPIPFVEDPNYMALQTEANIRWGTYVGTREMLGYEETNLALQTFLAYTSYELSVRSF